MGRSTNEETLGMTQRLAETMLKRGLDLVFGGPWWNSRFLLSRLPALEPQTMWGPPAWQTGLCCLGRKLDLREVLVPAQMAPVTSWGPQLWPDRPRCRHRLRWAYRPRTACGPGRWGRSHHQTDCSSGLPAQLPAQHPGSRQVPGVVTHCLPGAVVVDLHTALTPAPAAGQPHHGQIYRSPGPGQLKKLPSLLK